MIAVIVVATALAAACPEPDRMVHVPAGAFWMGSDRAGRAQARALSSAAVREARWFDAEMPRRRVTLRAFCIDRHLVTQAEYATFVVATAHSAPSISREEYVRQGFLVHAYEDGWTRYLWRDQRPPAGREDHPVVLVSTADAEAYCDWRGGRRVPTEAEWEKAARGVDGRIFPWGAAWDPERVNSAERGPRGTTAVGTYVAGRSPYGLLDAVGNVFQWTASKMPGRRRVLKGCAWDDEAGLCRPAFRHGRPAGTRHILIGFRCAE